MKGLPAPPPQGMSALSDKALVGQVVAITGGATGLGKAMALEFARLGASIAIWSRNESRHEHVVQAIESLGTKVIACVCDIRDPALIEKAFNTTAEQLGPVSVLVNNAAGNFPVPAENMSPNAWRTVIDIVLNGTFNCSREFARRHIDDGTPGSIINIGASYAWTGGPGFSHSAAAKAGVKNMTESLAVEWAPYGIRVNGLVPGLFPHEDESSDIKAVPGRGDSRSENKSCPALRTGELREIGWAATFLASPYASFITGHTLVVDGANWQRRTLRQPDFIPIREQMGKDPFSLT